MRITGKTPPPRNLPEKPAGVTTNLTTVHRAVLTPVIAWEGFSGLVGSLAQSAGHCGKSVPLHAPQEVGDSQLETLGQNVDCADRGLLASVLQLADVDFSQPGQLRQVRLIPPVRGSQFSNSSAQPHRHIYCHSSSFAVILSATFAFRLSRAV